MLRIVKIVRSDVDGACIGIASRKWPGRLTYNIKRNYKKIRGLNNIAGKRLQDSHL